MTHIIQGPGLRAEVHTDRGARLVSLRGVEDFEWLSPSERTAAAGAGQPFVRPGMGGWDEVAPSVQSDGAIPDHGDVWNLEWTVVSASSEELTLSVQLQSLPVRLERKLAVTDAGLRLSYVATTTSAGPVPFMWCAHPQFVATVDTLLTLEMDGAEVMPKLLEMYPADGTERSFPAMPLHGSMSQGSSMKAFVAPEVLVDAAVLRQSTGQSLRLAWDPQQLPYLGLFWDNGEFAAEPIIAVEPATGLGDRLSSAAALHRVRKVSRDQPLTWSLELSAS